MQCESYAEILQCESYADILQCESYADILCVTCLVDQLVACVGVFLLRVDHRV